MNIGEIVTTVVGNLAGTPELRFTASGKAVANFTIAENHSKKVGNDWVDDGASFIRVTVWGNLAENVVESFPEQGMPIMAYGSLRMKQWEGDDGVNRVQPELTAMAVGPNLALSVAEVRQPQRKWAKKNVADEMFDDKSSETKSKTETKADFTDDAKGSESPSKTVPAARKKTTPEKAESK
ncbi:single-stranded DNA-binding protein [Streptomyces sp. NPDC023838]|uniref:single-stranded DNA-binding protein n=1 Tax=Streptomyces sp. NPDC023838 TaxID=3154325 RepID=UPI0033E5334A